MARISRPLHVACRVFFVVLALTPRANADLPDGRDHSLPCRPTVSCTADIASPGTLEVESGFLTTRATSGPSVITNPFLIKQTLTKAFQIQVTSNGATFQRGTTHGDYLDDIDVGAKIHFVDQGKIMPSIAITALIGIPTFTTSTFSPSVEALVTAHASKDIGPVHADANVGELAYGIGASPVAQVFAAFALSTSLPGPFGIALETYIVSDASPVASRDGGVRCAISATPKAWLVFDFGADVGFYPSTRAFSAFFGMTIIPVVLWRR